MRTFQIYTEASIADPAHLIMVAEITDPLNVVQYSSTQPLQHLLQLMELKANFDAGHAKGVSWVLDYLGMSFEEFLEKRKK